MTLPYWGDPSRTIGVVLAELLENPGLVTRGFLVSAPVFSASYVSTAGQGGGREGKKLGGTAPCDLVVAVRRTSGQGHPGGEGEVAKMVVALDLAGDEHVLGPLSL